MKKLLFLLVAVVVTMSGCFNNSDNIVNVYTHRHYKADEEVYKEFTRQTGIKVNIIKSAADQLISRLELEGENTPADVLITVDAGRLWRAKEKALLQPIESEILKENIPAHLKDKENFWFGFSYRTRAIVYSKERVDTSLLTTYEALTDTIWRGRFLPRSSSNEYNQSLMASFIAHWGEEKAVAWTTAMVNNFTRIPKGSDTDIINEIANGVGDIALVNSYYLAKMYASAIATEKAAAAKVGLYFPNQKDRGAHINISGVGVVKHVKHKENAIKLVEFLSGEYAQKTFTELNFEYPVNAKVEMCKTLNTWGTFKADTLDLSLLGKYNAQAVKIFDRAGWY
jgi:iron(III) transport system substrate-binding protein